MALHCSVYGKCSTSPCSTRKYALVGTRLHVNRSCFSSGCPGTDLGFSTPNNPDMTAFPFGPNSADFGSQMAKSRFHISFARALYSPKSSICVLAFGGVLGQSSSGKSRLSGSSNCARKRPVSTWQMSTEPATPAAGKVGKTRRKVRGTAV